MIRIRPYRDSDREKILRWCRDEKTYYEWSFGFLGDYPLTEEKFEGTGKYSRFTAIDGDEPAGFFTVRNPGDRVDELRFGFVIVDPEKRGRGIAKEMLRQGIAFAFDIYRAERVSLGVVKENAPAYACYSAIGFTETGRTEAYQVGDAVLTAVEMEVIGQPDNVK